MSEFGRLVGDLDYPMWVVTAAADDERDGCLVGFATQCSIGPARFLVCLSKKNRTFRIAQRARVLGVHLLAEDQRDLAQVFGGETDDEPWVDKLGDRPWHPGPEGVPLLDEARSWFAGTVLERLDAGDHVVHLLEPVAAQHDGPLRPLLFQQARDIEAGHPA
jgi:flavin reductase (DIM6/NTAB) family NADH-FMN oxidoreductase RutF